MWCRLGGIPGRHQPLEVAWRPLFTTLEEAQRYQDGARSGKKKLKAPTPASAEATPPNLIPTTEPTQPTNPTNPPSGPLKMCNPTTGYHEV